MIKLTRDQRNELLRVGGAYMRRYPVVWRRDVADHIFAHMMNHEDVYKLEAFEAIDISDYAYGVACFLVRETY